MSDTHDLHIVSFGLIAEAQDGDCFRHVVFRDTVNLKEADLLVSRKARPGLWADLEEMENGRSLPPYKGYITRYGGADLVVFENEALEDVIASQLGKTDIQAGISRREAEKLREGSLGYCTNDTFPGAMEVGWRRIAQDTRLIRFRYYEGNGHFSWSSWYEIEEGR